MPIPLPNPQPSCANCHSVQRRALSVRAFNYRLFMSPEFQEIKKLRKEKKLHGFVAAKLATALRELFPDWVAVPEVAQTPGGRNDLLFFRGGGHSICFELFATKSQVDRDLLLLYESSAERKVAILIDREVDPTVSEAFYRKKPHRPFPAIWATDILFESRKTNLHLKLTEAVLGQGWAGTAQVIRQLLSTGHDRMLRRWRAEGLEITVDLETVTMCGVFVFLVWKRLHELGCESSRCKHALKAVADAFDFVMRQTVFGVPMILRISPKGASVLDLGDHEAVLWSSLLGEQGDHIFVFLNSVYDEMSALHVTPLPKRRPVAEFMDVMLQGRRMLAQQDGPPSSGGSDVRRSGLPTNSSSEEGS